MLRLAGPHSGYCTVDSKKLEHECRTMYVCLFIGGVGLEEGHVQIFWLLLSGKSSDSCRGPSLDLCYVSEIHLHVANMHECMYVQVQKHKHVPFHLHSGQRHAHGIYTYMQVQVAGARAHTHIYMFMYIYIYSTSASTPLSRYTSVFTYTYLIIPILENIYKYECVHMYMYIQEAVQKNRIVFDPEKRSMFKMFSKPSDQRFPITDS